MHSRTNPMHMQDVVLRLSKWRGGGHMLARCRRFTVPGGEAPAGGFQLCSAIIHQQREYRESASSSRCQSVSVPAQSSSSSFPSPIGHAPPKTNM